VIVPHTLLLLGHCVWCILPDFIFNVLSYGVITDDDDNDTNQSPRVSRVKPHGSKLLHKASESLL